MKKIVILLVIIFLVTGCTSKNDAGVVNILNWSSYIPDSVILDFEKETGIKVNYGTYSSNEECLAKIQSAKPGTYDLIFPSDYMIELMKKRNLLEPLDREKILNWNNIADNYRRLDYDKENKYSLPFLAATTVIVVNREHIKDTITSYQDLLKPEYKNNIVLLDDQRIVIGMALQALGYDMNETNKEALKDAKEWLLKLKENVKAFDSDSPKTFFLTNEVDIGVMWNAEAAIAKNKNPNLEVIYPKEGVAISIDNFASPKGAKHKEQAYLFIDYILRPEVMQKIIEDYPYKNVNQATNLLLSSNYLNNPASNIPDYVIKNGHFVNNIGDSILDYDKLWAEIK